MREIKFRAWTDNQMIYFDKLFMRNTGNFWGGNREVWELSSYFAKGEPESGIGYFHDDFAEPVEDYILMQYTGLKDKNGKEIYEGDILEKEGARIVIKCEDWLEFYADCLDENHPNWCDDWIRDFYRIENFEIIGNIHENPELL